MQFTSNRHALKQQRKEERQKEQEIQRLAQTSVQRQRKIKTYALWGIIGIILLGALIYFILSQRSKPGPYDAFAQCLTEKGVVMYGAYWCPHCTNQKKLFGSSFRYVTYVECDPKGKDAQPELCLQKGVESYPTWEINGTTVSGEMPLPVLAEKSGCSLVP